MRVQGRVAVKMKIGARQLINEAIFKLCKSKMVLTFILTTAFTSSGIWSHLCWNCSLTLGSFEVSWFFNWRPACIRATTELLPTFSTSDKVFKNSGCAQGGKRGNINGMFHEDNHSTIIQQSYGKWTKRHSYSNGQWAYQICLRGLFEIVQRLLQFIFICWNITRLFYCT